MYLKLGKALCNHFTFKLIIKNFKDLLLTALMLFCSLPGHANSSLNDTNYLVLVADINGDGLDDFFFRAQPKVITLSLDDDFIFSLPVPPVGPSFILLSTPTGSYQIKTGTIVKTMENRSWRSSEYVAVRGDGNIAPAGALYIYATSPAKPVFVVEQNPASMTLSLSQQSGIVILQNEIQFLSQNVPSNMVGGSYIHIDISVRNAGSSTWPADGSYRLRFQDPAGAAWNQGISKEDSVAVKKSVRPGETYEFSFDVKAPIGNHNLIIEIVDGENIPFGASQASSVSVRTPSPAETWPDFISALKSNNKKESLLYFADKARFDPLLDVLDGKLELLARSLSEPYFIVMEPTFASAVVLQTQNETTLRHYVNFSLVNGVWLITTF